MLICHWSMGKNDMSNYIPLFYINVISYAGPNIDGGSVNLCQ